MEASETGAGGAPKALRDASVPTVSVVIPAYNEARRIDSSLEKILTFIDNNELAAEIIVVDDGSDDGTSQITGAHSRHELRNLVNDTNHGKGYSVRRGFLEAKGTYVLFTDADLSAPIDELAHLLEFAREGADIIVGSRAVDRGKIVIHQPRTRELGGILYNWAVQVILGLPIKDTQCGFKLFRRDVMLPIFQRQTIQRFGFDPEILFLARKSGLEIREIPVSWSHDAGSKVRFLSDGIGMFLDLIHIRWNWMRGRYR